MIPKCLICLGLLAVICIANIALAVCYVSALTIAVEDLRQESDE